MNEPLMFAWLQSRALITLGGPDWRGFLQGLITQDVETLAPGEARFGALLTPQGRLLHDLFVVGRPEGCWLDVLAEHRTEIVLAAARNLSACAGQLRTGLAVRVQRGPRRAAAA